MNRICLLTVAAILAGGCSGEKYLLSEHVGVNRSVDPQAAVEAGCKFIEVGISGNLVPDQDDSVWAEKKEFIKSLPLPTISANGFYPKTFHLTGPEADEQVNLAYAETAFKRGSEVGIKYYVLGSSKARNIPEGFSREEGRAQFISLCKGMGRIAAKYDVTVVIEPLRSAEANFINTVKEGTEICREVNDPHICVLADLYHMAEENEGAESIIDAAEWLKHCHIAEKGTRAAPGTGGDDFTAYFNALKKIGYKGSLSLECRWTDYPNEIGPSIAETKRQLQSVNY